MQKLIGWLNSDQFEYGEWGKCEINDPSNSVKTIDDSKIKPNMFTSSQAFYSLSGIDSKNLALNLFINWIEKIRDDKGYWTSAVGRQSPVTQKTEYDAVRNIRHCAKGLDILLFIGKAYAEDSDVFDFILNSQNDDGSFPQFKDGRADIWTTAYVINLFLRLLLNNNYKKYTKRNVDEEKWKTQIITKLDKATNWMIEQLNDKWLWCDHNGKPSTWFSEALLAEIGGHLKIKKPEICDKIVSAIILNENELRPVAIWGLILVKPVLTIENQKIVIKHIEDFVNSNSFEPKDTYEAACALRIFFFKDNYDLVDYYSQISFGHESILTHLNEWNNDEYNVWCVKSITEKIRQNTVSLISLPNTKIDAWQSSLYLLQRFKLAVENDRLWELLWIDKNTPVDENKVQAAFWSLVKPWCNEERIVIREPETGSGPVDFEYINKYLSRIYIEFKLTSNAKLTEGLDQQLVKYLKSESLNSGIFIVICFKETEKERFKEVERALIELKESDPLRFYYTIFIDATRKLSASKI